MQNFKIESEYTPKGGQPDAIDRLVKGLNRGYKDQTLLGVTGSGKTYTIANVIERVQKPTLVIAHNKTLAAQLCSEFKEFFPNSIVEYFVSYYDYYQPEAYIPSSDTYIEKDSSRNEEIDRLRHSATAALLERRDVIIVASVSCIYGLGDPDDYKNMMLSLRPGMIKSRETVIEQLVDIQYQRNDIDFSRGKFRVRGDVLEIHPAYSSKEVFRVEFFGDEIERITQVNPITGEIVGKMNHLAVFPASHFVTTIDKMKKAYETIKVELVERLKELKADNKLVEAQRLEQRTLYDLEMIKEIGFCQGIENYSRHISGRAPGTAPFTLMDFFPDDFLLMIDESHVTIPQIRAMYNGDQARKQTLVDYGFRLPSAKDNRPLNFDEFNSKINQVIYVSATPAEYEREKSNDITELIIRPTGLIDPEISVRPVKGQIDDLISEVNKRVEKKERVLVTTLTKRMAEDLTEYLIGVDLKVRYMHSDVDTLERIEILKDLRLGVFDVLVGINLLREGLDLPEVSLVIILDADQEGFLRSETALVQTIGRAARHVEGKVIMYADRLTGSMERAISETNRRRKTQENYNREHGINPQSIKKMIYDNIKISVATDKEDYKVDKMVVDMEKDSLVNVINGLTKEMKQAAMELNFERAAALRDQIEDLKRQL
jgi:excinuclease ABC subunit B